MNGADDEAGPTVPDRSNGWDAIADSFIEMRSAAGADIVEHWARQLPRGATIVDVGCGSGVPVSQTLIQGGFRVYGIDASARLIGAFHERFPDQIAACEPAQDSAFFNRKFDAAVAIGLLFLLTPEEQQAVLARMASALEPTGRVLFSAPAEPCQWADSLTGRRSISLGGEAYVRVMRDMGQALQDTYRDDGGNHYFSFGPARPPFTP